ncbi:MAG: hypothetical protein Ct9H300mP1_00930 [Planctomycetaceae bacterium]|nr:MAG: hypothetical protein Ct9H300mP1_00930 [Planctomycetaceae bacterium]
MRSLLTGSAVFFVLGATSVAVAADKPVDFVGTFARFSLTRVSSVMARMRTLARASCGSISRSLPGKKLSPGKPADSELLKRITSRDPDHRMPPADSKRTLSSREINILQRWVKQGGRYKAHWSFQPVAAVQVPAVKNGGWCRSPIDRFVLSRLEAGGVVPTREAARERLIRRVTFDLTGLPPTLEQIDAFLADKSDKAFDKVVDRLLESPAFGERMAAEWLDIARYSDSYGYQVDRDRHVWPYRDWVVRAFNSNMPYDQFVTWQLAGDLVPKPTRDSRLATTFNRLHSQKVEGGSTPEEFRVEYVADRNHTFAMAFLGLTLECARCHQHKFDPIAQEEYYQFFAFFNNIDESGVYSYFTSSVPTPTLLLSNDKQKAAMVAPRRRCRIGGELAKGDRSATGGIRQVAGSSQARRQVAQPVAGARLPQRFREGARRCQSQRYGTVWKGPARLTGDDGIGTGVGNFRRFQPFSVSLWMLTPEEKKRAIIFHRSRAWTDAGTRGLPVDARRRSSQRVPDPLLAGQRVASGHPSQFPRLATGISHHDWDGSNRARGLKI